MTMEHLTPIHPGLVLQDELDELEITQTLLAQHIGVLPDQSEYMTIKPVAA